MTIERLEELKSLLWDVTHMQENFREMHKEPEMEADINALIDAEIERLQSNGEYRRVNVWEDLMDFVYFNARESYQEMSNLIFMYLDAKGVNFTVPVENIEQLPCEWCSEYSGDISAEKWLSCEEDGYTHHYLSQQPVNYCPNCGQALDWSEE